MILLALWRQWRSVSVAKLTKSFDKTIRKLEAHRNNTWHQAVNLREAAAAKDAEYDLANRVHAKMRAIFE